MTGDGNRPTANTYFNAANKISAGIESKLLVHNGSTAYFIEGLDDNVQSLDADALGTLYLESHGENTVAQEVLAYATSAFALSGRSIVHSSDNATYNMDYAARGLLSGFRPYLGTGAPNVLWTEGSAEMQLAQASLGQSTAAVKTSLGAIAAITSTDAPLQADQASPASRTARSTTCGPRPRPVPGCCSRRIPRHCSVNRILRLAPVMSDSACASPPQS